MADKSSNRPEEAVAQSEYENATDANFIRFPDKPFPHSMLLVFEEYNYDGFKGMYADQLTNPTSTSGAISSNRQSGIGLRSQHSIELPFPKQLTDSTGLIYNNMQQNPLIEGLTQKIRGFADGSGSAVIGDIPGQLQRLGASAATAMAGGTGGAGKAIGEIANQIQNTSQIDAANAAMYLLRKYIPDELGKSVNLAMGQVLNPRETIAFEGVQLKQHQFNWDLYPSNAQDSARIQDIIKHMKRAVLPVTRDLGSGDGGIKRAFLQFPHVCKIYLIGIDQTYYMKFKPAMITNMTVDYGAGGTLGIMQGGRPAGVNISITLQELQIETANDYGAMSPEPSNGRLPEDPPEPDLAMNTTNMPMNPDVQVA